MLFDQVRELPVATVWRAPGARVGLAVGGIRRWLARRWQWFRPRTVPVFVALLGMLAVLQSVRYLAHPRQEPAPARFAVITGDPADATIPIDDEPVARPYVPAVSSSHPVRLVPAVTRSLR